MGCTTSQHEDPTAKARNEAIESQLKRDRQVLQNEVKMLLLGAGESGKSTVLKQMRLIHNKPYDMDERESYKEIIFSNTVQSMRVLLEGVGNMGIQLDPSNRGRYDLIMSSPSQIEGDIMPSALADAVYGLWNDAGVRKAYRRRNELQINDSAPYYFNSIGRIGATNFTPTDQDILRARVKTTGISETTFVIGDLTYKLFDVGGQRSERKKWIHCFESCNAIVFLVAISEYDQKLYEDESVNRMSEALTLFDSICNSRWFIRTSIILFLNKIDIFREKLPVSPMSHYFPEFRGDDQSYDQTSAFLLDKFVGLNQNLDKSIYAHYTCATDTKALSFVLSAVNDVIIQSNLRDCGLI